MQIKKTLEFDVLKEHFHLPMVDVAKKFGICTTVFKRMCRNHGIKRWPYRKLQSIERRMFVLGESFLPLNPQESKELQQLTETKDRIMQSGTPFLPGQEEDDEFDVPLNASIAEPSPPAPADEHTAKKLPAPSVAKSELSHVTLSGCEIGITLGAVQQLARLFWPTDKQETVV
eukprot:TRINITY_DN6459_c0_g1_i2.p1 TRINITY_DN6459_c0_g1~~TRINITY_DN6459_c0_g1_i2.p1  ORF type:complete len:173 (+),score=28.34 TRINITY_DN6459_c0_g1_i2:245-763(+)